MTGRSRRTSSSRQTTASFGRSHTVSHDSELEIVDADDIEEPEAAHRPLCPSWWAIHRKIAAAYADAHRAHEERLPTAGTG
jgi:hypothetical protein